MKNQKSKKPRIVTQGVRLDHSGDWMETMYSNGRITVTPMTKTEVEKWKAEHPQFYGQRVKTT